MGLAEKTRDAANPAGGGSFSTDAPRDLFFFKSLESGKATSDEFNRNIFDSDGAVSWVVDSHARYGARICYLRFVSDGKSIKLTLGAAGDISRIASSRDFGTLLSVSHKGTHYTVWLPQNEKQLRPASHGRFQDATDSHLTCEWSFVPRIELKMLQQAKAGELAVLPYVVVEDDQGEFFKELASLSEIERRLYRKSDWFYASRPSDVWNYLINGGLYDPRTIKGVGKRFKCQQCAFAWWSYLQFLHDKTGKKIYRLLRDEVACSVLLDLSDDGEWGHGFWSDEMETHTRFQVDGLHLLLSQHEKTKDPVWLNAAERGTKFVFDNLSDSFDDGSRWFLHDTLERKKKHRFKSTLFGKNPGNSLCVNTHVQTLTVLYRLRELAPDVTIYRDSFDDGLAALRRVLDHQPGEFFYRPLAKLFMGYLRGAAPSDNPRARIRNGIRHHSVVTVYRRLKRLMPRLTLSNGFIDRDLTLGAASDHYHITNLKDLLTLYRQAPEPWLRGYIMGAFGFALPLVRRWGLDKAVVRSPYYFEFMDILHLYDRLIEPLTPGEIPQMEAALRRSGAGYSLDFYASELVRG